MADVDSVNVQRVLQQFEHDIVDVNREHIGKITGEIDKNDILKIGEAISICRANYLKSILQMAKADENTLPKSLDETVKPHRLLYEESMLGFAALRHALERGYVVIKDQQ